MVKGTNIIEKLPDVLVISGEKTAKCRHVINRDSIDLQNKNENGMYGLSSKEMLVGA